MPWMAACGSSTAVHSALRPIDRAALQAVVDTTARELLVPGVLVVLTTPQGEFTVASGTTTLGATLPPRTDTHFRIASNTKTMTAAVIVQLAQEGRLAFADPVSKYVSGVPDGDHITIADLLDMRSGLYCYTDAPEVSERLDRNPTKVWTAADVLAVAFAQPPKFPPGTDYSYCNTNYALLGLVAEAREGGKSLAAIFQERLFGPLGMNNTLLPASTSNVIPEPYSHGYLYGGAAYALLDGQVYPPDVQAMARAGTLPPNDDTEQNPSYASAAGGVISTADDLVTWMQALVGGKVFNATYQRLWLDSLRPEDPNQPQGAQYGYGIAQLRFGGNAIFFHGGEMPGFNSFMGYDPTNRVTLVVWTNLTVSLDGLPTANSIMLKVLDQAYVESPLRQTQVSPAP
ncbi:MAG: serine hydrolase domain-containing protein [bacterium]